MARSTDMTLCMYTVNFQKWDKGFNIDIIFEDVEKMYSQAWCVPDSTRLAGKAKHLFTYQLGII